MKSLRTLTVLATVTGSLLGQDRETFYTFNERAPKSKLEKTISKVLPSIVKVLRHLHPSAAKFVAALILPRAGKPLGSCSLITKCLPQPRS